jgi:hypothetical protein
MAATAIHRLTLDPMGKCSNVFVVSEKKAFEHFPIGSNVNLCIAVAAILVGSRDHRTQFWKGTTQESLQQSLVDIGSVVSEEKIFF